MKRDLDLVRSIFIDMEAKEQGFFAQSPVIDGYTEEEVGHHVYIPVVA